MLLRFSWSYTYESPFVMFSSNGALSSFKTHSIIGRGSFAASFLTYFICNLDVSSFKNASSLEGCTGLSVASWIWSFPHHYCYWLQRSWLFPFYYKCTLLGPLCMQHLTFLVFKVFPGNIYILFDLVWIQIERIGSAVKK